MISVLVSLPEGVLLGEKGDTRAVVIKPVAIYPDPSLLVIIAIIRKYCSGYLFIVTAPEYVYSSGQLLMHFCMAKESKCNTKVFVLG